MGVWRGRQGQYHERLIWYTKLSFYPEVSKNLSLMDLRKGKVKSSLGVQAFSQREKEKAASGIT